MKRIVAAAVLGLALAVLAAPAAGAQAPAKAAKPKLPEKHRAWLEEEVEYIIAPMEREVFLKLQSDRERDLFIEAFWKQRDPNPGTPENEFKTEHGRRLAYADRYLGRDAPGPAGARTAAACTSSSASPRTSSASRASPRPTTPRSGSIRA
ncbi:MAG: GWxTD domain-containing protein [Candidatus Moduliflexus flocculans]|nr:GWxTD domain-containing protein [Candidatus Moduliflexus flocculans]